MERRMPLNACRWDRLRGILDWGSLKPTLVSIAVYIVNFPPASTAPAQILLDLWVASPLLGCLALP